MKRIQTLLASLILVLTISAQIPVLVGGNLAGAPATVPVTIETVQGTLPVISTTTQTLAGGNFIDTLFLTSNTGWIQVSFIDCNGTQQSSAAQYQATPIGSAVTFSLIYCNTGSVDCLGVPGGTALPGTACDDNNPLSVNDLWDANCICQGTIVDCLGVTNGTALPGTPCNDNDSTTTNDTWNASCICMGIPATWTDCLGVTNGTNLPGTPCDDGDPNTTNDTWDANCNCVGGNNLPCNAAFAVVQATTPAGVTIPGSINVTVLNQTAFGFQYLWDFGDGNTSTQAYPVHTYTGNGPYLLCLTLSSPGCTSTYCDTLTVDTNGLIVPGQSGAAGFTINVMQGGANSIAENTATAISAFPNPSNGLIRITGVAVGETIEVLDMQGKLVHRATISSASTLDLSHLNAGTYMIRLNTLAGNSNTRVVLH